MGKSKNTLPSFLVLGSLILTFLITRLYNLTLLPIFTDEAIYIYWAKFIAVNHSHWFLSVTDGKPPLLIWFITILISIFPSDLYLLAGRLPSVVMGIVTLTGVFTLSLQLFKSQKVAILASIFAIFSPFILLYDRMALFDSMLMAFLLWSVIFAIKTADKRKWRYALLWGVSLGLAFLSKPTAIIFLLITPLCYILSLKKFDSWKEHALKIIVALGIAEGMNNLLRLSSAYPAMALKNQQFQVPYKELLEHPFYWATGNIYGFFSWIIPYYTLPIFIGGILAFCLLFLKRPRTGIILCGIWLIPLLVLSTFGREIFPRYILFTTPYFLMVLSWGIFEIGKKWDKLPYIFSFFLLLLPLHFDFLILTAPHMAPLPKTDRNQYVTQGPSGYGLSPIFSMLNEKAKDKHITVVTQGTFGLYPYAFSLEYWDNKNVSILPRWPLEELDDEILQIGEREDVYLIFKEYKGIPDGMPVTILTTGMKPENMYPIFLTILNK